MKTKSYFFKLVILLFLSCNYNKNKLSQGKVFFTYSTPVIVDVDTVKDKKILDFMTSSDSIVVRFMSTYKNEKVVVYISDNILFRVIDSLSTNESVGYASSLRIPKNKNETFTIRMRNKEYHLPFKKGFYFIDLYIKPDDVLEANYNNTVLFLS